MSEPIRKAHAVVIITVMSFSLAVVELFAFNLFCHRGKRPGGALLAVELLAGLLTQLFLRDELLHSLIGSLNKGSIITVYRCEEVADNGIPFTLISKWTKPDADGRSSLEDLGWVATEYLTEDPDWVWVYGD